MWQLKNLICQEYFKNDPLVETCFTLFTNIVGSSTWRHVNAKNIREVTMQLKNAFNYIPI